MFSGAGRNLAIKRILVHFESKIYTFCCIKETRKPLFSEQNSEAEILMLCIELNYKKLFTLNGVETSSSAYACLFQSADLTDFRFTLLSWNSKTYCMVSVETKDNKSTKCSRI